MSSDTLSPTAKKVAAMQLSVENLDDREDPNISPQARHVLDTHLIENEQQQQSPITSPTQNNRKQRTRTSFIKTLAGAQLPNPSQFAAHKEPSVPSGSLLKNNKAQWRRSTADLFSSIMLSGTRSQVPSVVEEAVGDSESDDRSIIGCWRLVPRRHYKYAESSSQQPSMNHGFTGDKKNGNDNEKQKEHEFLQKQSDYLQKIVTAFQEEQKIRRRNTHHDVNDVDSEIEKDDSIDEDDVNFKERLKRDKEKKKEQEGVDRFAFSMKTDSYKVEYKVEYLCEERNQVIVLALSATTYVADYFSTDNRSSSNGSGSGSGWFHTSSSDSNKIYASNDSNHHNINDSSDHSSIHHNQHVNYIKCKKYIPIFSNDKIVRRIMEMIHETYIFYVAQEKEMNRRKRIKQLRLQMMNANTTAASPNAVSRVPSNEKIDHSYDEDHNQHPQHRVTLKQQQQHSQHRSSIFNRRSTLIAKEISMNSAAIVTKFLKSSSGSRKIRVIHIDRHDEDGGFQDNHKAFLYYFTIETAIDHYAKYLTPKGQLYCGWIGPQKLLRNEDYCFPRLPTNISSTMCTHVGSSSKFGQVPDYPTRFLYRIRSTLERQWKRSQNIRQKQQSSINKLKPLVVHVINRKEITPLVAVAWGYQEESHDNNGDVNVKHMVQLAVYELYTGRQIYSLEDELLSPKEKQQVKVVQSCWRHSYLYLIVGFANGSVAQLPIKYLDSVVHNSITVFKLVPIPLNDQHEPCRKGRVISVHDNEAINAIHVSTNGKFIYTCSYDRSFCVLSWNKDDKLVRLAYSLSHIINDDPRLVGIQLSIASLPTDDDGEENNGLGTSSVDGWNDCSLYCSLNGKHHDDDRSMEEQLLYSCEDIFTTGWQDIRYWKYEGNQQFSSYRFPTEHLKKVACMAVYEFPTGNSNMFGLSENTTFTHGGGTFSRGSSMKELSMSSIKYHSNEDETGAGNVNIDDNEESTSVPVQLCKRHMGSTNAASNTVSYSTTYSSGRKRSNKQCRVLVSGSLDTTAIVWDVTDPINPTKVRHLIGHTGEITCVKIIPVDDVSPLVVTGSADKSVRCWDLLSGIAFRHLSVNPPLTSLDVLRVDSSNDIFGMTGEMIVTAEGPTGSGSGSINLGTVFVRNFLNNHREITQYSDGVLSITSLPPPTIHSRSSNSKQAGLASNVEVFSAPRSTTESPTADDGATSQLPSGNLNKAFSFTTSSATSAISPVVFGTSNGDCVVSVSGHVLQVLEHRHHELDVSDRVELQSNKDSKSQPPMEEKEGKVGEELSSTASPGNTTKGRVGSKWGKFESDWDENDHHPNHQKKQSSHSSQGDKERVIKPKPEGSYRVNAVVTHVEPVSGDRYIFTGLGTGQLVVWRQQRLEEEGYLHRFERFCWCQGDDAAIFALAIHDSNHPAYSHFKQDPSKQGWRSSSLGGNGTGGNNHNSTSNRGSSPLKGNRPGTARHNQSNSISTTKPYLFIGGLSSDIKLWDIERLIDLAKTTIATSPPPNIKSNVSSSRSDDGQPAKTARGSAGTSSSASSTGVYLSSQMLINNHVVIRNSHLQLQHKGCIRCFAIHYPTSLSLGVPSDEVGSFSVETLASMSSSNFIAGNCLPTLFVSGSYDRTAVIWHFESLTPLIKLVDLHTSFIFGVEVFDDFYATRNQTTTKLTVKSNPNYVVSLENKLLIVTGDYTGKIGLWSIPKHEIQAQINKMFEEGSGGIIMKATEPLPWKALTSMRHIKDDESVTSLVLYVPRPSRGTHHSHDSHPPQYNHSASASSSLPPVNASPFTSCGNPLIVTGSIDNLIYIWQMETQELLHIIIGHSNRVNALALYRRYDRTYYDEEGCEELDDDDDSVMLLSGSDDGSLVYWEDSLSSNSSTLSSPPLSKNYVIRAFYKDLQLCSNNSTGGGTGGGNWPLMKLLVSRHPFLFLEFPFLFYLALIEKKESFFTTFGHYLSFSAPDDHVGKHESASSEEVPKMYDIISRIPSFRCSQPGCPHYVDILEYAIHTHSLVALRAVLVSWKTVLTLNLDDAISQKFLVATYSFNELTLLELARTFPVEYTDFLYSLRLVRNHASAECVTATASSSSAALFTVIPDGKRTIYIGSSDIEARVRKSQEDARHHRRLKLRSRPLLSTMRGGRRASDSSAIAGHDNTGSLDSSKLKPLAPLKSPLLRIASGGNGGFGKGKQKATSDEDALVFRDSFLDRVASFLVNATSLFEYHPPVRAQPVMPLSVPLKKFATIQQLAALIEASDEIGNIQVFDNPVVNASIKHYWESFGWKVHLLAFLQYLLTIFIFTACIYLFPGAIDGDEKKYRQVQRANLIFGFLMVMYGVDEIFQVFGKVAIVYRSHLTFSMFTSLFFDHLFGDIWNLIDSLVVSTGLVGVITHFKILASCYDEVLATNVTIGGQGDDEFNCYNQYRQSITFSNCVLAVTAVMLWFKVLYFLRPTKSAGQFVAMVIKIMSDIKFFLFVLACVLTGFAQGFWLMINRSTSTVAFSTIKMSYFTTFMYMFGELEAGDMDGAENKAFAIFFLVSFMMTMMLLMLNLLIALMGDSFGKAKDNIQRIYRKELAAFMIEQSMPTILLMLLSYFHLLEYSPDEIIFIVKYTSDIREVEPKHALENSLQVCNKILRESPQNIANAPKKSREADIIDR